MLRIVLAALVMATAFSCAAPKVRPPIGADRPRVDRVFLACYIDRNSRQFYVGCASRVSKGTPIYYSGKIDNGAMTSGKIALPADIPAHLFIILMYNPRFDPGTPCQAWIDERPPAAQANP
jgi:hypothetical protein